MYTPFYIKTLNPSCQWVYRPAKTLRLSIFERRINSVEDIIICSVDAFLQETTPYSTHRSQVHFTLQNLSKFFL